MVQLVHDLAIAGPISTSRRLGQAQLVGQFRCAHPRPTGYVAYGGLEVERLRDERETLKKSLAIVFAELK
jgi:hypothetical protein